jgi:predicted metal-binding membrane protein
LVVVAGAGYFSVWMALGAMVFPGGTALAVVAARLPALAAAMPFAVGAVVLGAGVLQLSGWKARRLACCRRAPDDVCARRAGAAAAVAWWYGVMAVVTVAIAAERLAPNGERVARIVGSVAIGAGAARIACAAAGLV